MASTRKVMGNPLPRIALLLLRLGLAALFLFFGILAILDPAGEAIWLAPWVAALPLVGTPAFLLIFGVLEFLIGLALALGICLRYTSLVAAAMLLGIVINLGWSQIAMRDLALMAAALVLATSEDNAWQLWRCAL